MMSPSDGGLSIRAFCSAQVAEYAGSSAAVKSGTNTDLHWLAGIAVDHTLPIRSIMVVADVFSERYEGIGRPTDWTGELGARKQISTRLVADLGLGRHFRGISPSWFATFGTTISLAFLP
jgi:hypothetical protein